MQRRNQVLAAGLALLLACSDSNSPASRASGSLSFTYTGGGGGSFNVSGGMPINQDDFFAHNWAAGGKDVAGSTIAALGLKARGNAHFDFAGVSFHQLTTGTLQVDAACDPDLEENCTGFAMFVNGTDALLDAQFFCGLTAGMVTVTEVSDRAKGTFSGTGECSTDFQGTNPTAFAVTNGSFDVPLFEDAFTMRMSAIRASR